MSATSHHQIDRGEFDTWAADSGYARLGLSGSEDVYGTWRPGSPARVDIQVFLSFHGGPRSRRDPWGDALRVVPVLVLSPTEAKAFAANAGDRGSTGRLPWSWRFGAVSGTLVQPLVDDDLLRVNRVAGWRKNLQERIEEAECLLLNRPVCSRCGAPMRRKTNRTSGNHFWGCAMWPVCLRTFDVDSDVWKKSFATVVERFGWPPHDLPLAPTLQPTPPVRIPARVVLASPPAGAPMSLAAERRDQRPRPPARPRPRWLPSPGSMEDVTDRLVRMAAYPPEWVVDAFADRDGED